MKQNIIQISNIRFTDDVRINKPKDIEDTYIYEELYRQNDPMLAAVQTQMTEAEVRAASHVGFVLAQLHNFYGCSYDIETITPNDVRYQDAADVISTYVETDWWMDDADMVQSADIELLDDAYEIDYCPTLYMYFDDWIQHGYEALLGVDKWEDAFRQIIYEYMRHFFTVNVN